MTTHTPCRTRNLVAPLLLGGAIGLAGSLVPAGDAAAQGATADSSAVQSKSVPTSPRQALDQDWLVVTGKVGSVSDKQFSIDYGGGQVVVEMDSWQKDSRIKSLEKGDKVTVSGFADTLFFGSKTIEAASVYDFNDDTSYHASATDEEGDFRHFFGPVDRLDQGNRLTLTGTVQTVQGERMVISTNERPLAVNLSAAEGAEASSLQKGDRVKVQGILDNSLFAGMEVNAESVTALDGAASKDGQVSEAN